MARAMKVRESIEMRIVDTSNVKFLIVSLNVDILVDQERKAHRFHRRNHADRIVIAENGVGGCVDVRAQLFKARQRRIVWSEGTRPIVTSKNAEVITHIRRMTP